MFLGRDVVAGLGKGTPGPGAYGADETKKFGKKFQEGFSFGKNVQATSFANGSFTPGPGEYQGASASMMGPINLSEKPSSSNPKFSGSKRFNKIKAVGSKSGGDHDIIYAQEEDPGGVAMSVLSSMAHQKVSTKQSNPSYSFGTRVDDEIILKKHGGILHRKRAESDTASPGPGQYYKNPHASITESMKSLGGSGLKSSFPKAKRFHMKLEKLQGLEAPGPQYETATPMRSPHPISKYATAPNFSFGSDRFRLTEIRERNEEREDFPGPGSYNQTGSLHGGQLDSTKPSSPKFSFGGASRDAVTKMYMTKGSAGSSVDPNMRNAEIKTPGPGAYRPAKVSKYKKDASAKAHSFGLRTEFAVGERRPNTTPAVGPGAYRINSGVGDQRVSTRQSAAQYSMGKSTRSKQAFIVSPGAPAVPRKVSTPGPGEYLQSSSLGRQVVSSQKSSFVSGFSREPRSRSKIKNDVPGPGTYSAVGSTGKRQFRSSAKTAPSFGFGSSVRQPLEAGMVG